VEAHLIFWDRDPNFLDRDRVEQCRKNVADTVQGSIEQYAAVLGLQHDSKFQQDLNRALSACVLMHWNLPNRKGYSDIRKELLRVDKEAAAAAKCLRRLQAALDDLTPSYRDAIFKHLEMPIRSALKLRYLSNAAYNDARVLAGTNLGAPKMLVLTR
jgi:hypothetical protein